MRPRAGQRSTRGTQATAPGAAKTQAMGSSKASKTPAFCPALRAKPRAASSPSPSPPAVTVSSTWRVKSATTATTSQTMAAPRPARATPTTIALRRDRLASTPSSAATVNAQVRRPATTRMTWRGMVALPPAKWSRATNAQSRAYAVRPQPAATASLPASRSATSWPRCRAARAAASTRATTATRQAATPPIAATAPSSVASNVTTARAMETLLSTAASVAGPSPSAMPVFVPPFAATDSALPMKPATTETCAPAMAVPQTARSSPASRVRISQVILPRVSRYRSCCEISSAKIAA